MILLKTYNNWNVLTIDNCLKGIFIKLFQSDIFYDSKYKEKELLGSELNLTPRDLVALLFEIEDEFKIKISDNIIIKGEFNTYSNIFGILCDMLIS